MRDRILLGRQHIDRHNHAQRNMLFHMAMELPNTGSIGTEADNGPGTLPELEAIFAQWCVEVLRVLVFGRVVFAAPVEVFDASRMVVVGKPSVFSRAGIGEVWHQKACGLVNIAPGEVGDVDHLKEHPVHVNIVCRRGQIVQHNFNVRCILGDVQYRRLPCSTFVFRVQNWSGGLVPSFSTSIDVHVPATSG